MRKLKIIIIMVLGIILYSFYYPVFALTLSSSAFQSGGMIPSLYTCRGKNISPPLSWQDLPQGTQSLTLIVSDPDAPHGTWQHWLVFNIPASITSFAEGKLPSNTSIQLGINSDQQRAYYGPCPPTHPHHYHFNLYALDSYLSFKQAPDAATLLAEMQSHILAHVDLIGLY